MSRKKQKTQTEVMEALVKCGGIISKTAEMLQLASGNSLRQRIKNDPKLNAVLTDIRADILDIAEDNIITAIKAGDKELSWRYLTRLGGERGYRESIEVNGNLTIKQKPDLSNLSDEELKNLEELARKITKPE